MPAYSQKHYQRNHNTDQNIPSDNPVKLFCRKRSHHCINKSSMPYTNIGTQYKVNIFCLNFISHLLHRIRRDHRHTRIRFCVSVRISSLQRLHGNDYAVMSHALRILLHGHIGGLTRVIHNVREVLSKVSNGQFEDERLAENKRKDEFGDLASCTEKLRLKIYDILDDIRRGTVKLTEAVERLNRTSESTTQAAASMSGSVAQIEDTANRQQSGTTQAAQDVEATKQAIDEMLVQIEGINRISRDMENMSRESADILRELEESSKKAQDTVLDIRNQTDTTNESVKQIKSVTEYITNIAEETNLLALNASIEAARAGDAGRGFAVVAQQIQKLAEESNHSAAQIGENIKDLVEKTVENLAAMNLIGEVLKSQEDKVSRTKDIFGELDRSINMVTDKESNMQQNIKAMNRAKDNMSDVIAELAQSSVTNVNTAQVTAEAAGQMQEEIKGITELGSDLTGLAEDLNQNLQSFLS